jgi:hypothetical protein
MPLQSKKDETPPIVHISTQARTFVDVISFRVLSSFQVHNQASSLYGVRSLELVGNRDYAK